MNKTIHVKVAGQERIVAVEISENTTAKEILEQAGCPGEFVLTPGIGQPVYGADERVYDRVRDGGKVVAAPLMEVGIA